METKIEIQGIAALSQSMERLSKNLRRDSLVKFVRPAASIIAKAVRAKTPRRTGALRKAVKVKAYRSPASEPRVTVGVRFAKIADKRKPSGKKMDAYYALFVHNGTRIGAKKRRHRKTTARYIGETREGIKPNPFVYDAFEETAQRAGAEIIQRIQTYIEQ